MFRKTIRENYKVKYKKLKISKVTKLMTMLEYKTHQRHLFTHSIMCCMMFISALRFHHHT